MLRNQNVSTVLNVLGSLGVVMGFLLLVPIPLAIGFGEMDSIRPFVISSLSALGTGALLILIFKSDKISFTQSMLICGLAWIVLCFFASLPFYLGTEKNLLDSYFETVSGFTTTGITIYTNIEEQAKSILFWRSFIQWLGGLGILTFFLAITFTSSNSHFHLFSAEGHKIEASRPAPSIKKSAVILWSIYLGLTIAEIILLMVFGMSLYDAVNHTMTTLSTGGFSPYDASIDYYRQAGYEHYREIEYVLTLFMFLGGMNFFMHFMFFTGKIKEFFTNKELRSYTLIIVLVTGLILLNRVYQMPEGDGVGAEASFRNTLFTVVSIMTTTGYGTMDINASFFPAMATQFLLILMLVGGCVGSTAGGIKVQRSVILFRLFKMQLKKLRLPRMAISDVVYQGEIVSNTEIKRISGLFCGWLLLIGLGGFITAFFTDLNGWQSFSGMFSAVGNIGPCYFSVDTMSNLPGVVKLTYIFGMLAGRLEILPILLVFNYKAWKK